MLKKILFVVAATAVSVSAVAAGSHAYVGAQSGYVAHYGFDNSELTSTNGKVTTIDRFSTFSKEQGSSGERAYVGYMFNKYLGFEVGVGTFGSQNYAFGTTGAEAAKNEPYSLSTTALVGVDADLVAKLYMTDSFYAFAKAGMADVDFKTKMLDQQGTIDGKRAIYVWHWMPRAELGLGYNVSKHIAITVSYAHYFNMNTSTKLPAADGLTKSAFSKFAPEFGVAALGLTYSF